jgi:uncharacterized protein (TIGR01244 family)
MILGFSSLAISAEVKGPHDWNGLSVMQYDRFYIAAQLTVESLEGAKAAGVETIINIREPEEMTWDEKTAVEEAGFKYFHIPVSRQGKFEKAPFDAIDAAAAEGQVWIHCASGNRAAGWFAAYLVIKQGYSVDEALALGDQLGITNDGIRQKVREYVAQYGN